MAQIMFFGFVKILIDFGAVNKRERKRYGRKDNKQDYYFSFHGSGFWMLWVFILLDYLLLSSLTPPPAPCELGVTLGSTCSSVQEVTESIVIVLTKRM